VNTGFVLEDISIAVEDSLFLGDEARVACKSHQPCLLPPKQPFQATKMMGVGGKSAVA